MANPLYDEPSEVTAEEGEVQVDGPDGVAIALTPNAAAEISDRLLHGAAKAAGQQIEIDRLAKERAVSERR